MGYAQRANRTQAVQRKVERLRANYRAVVGRPFVSFYCPILFRDEPVELCKAHIVNSAFAGSTAWTVQRKDVDNFYGSAFESDFVILRDRGHSLEEVVIDKTLSKNLRPKFVVADRVIDYYVPKGGRVPSNHSPFLMEGEAGPIRIALKIQPSETLALASADWQIRIHKDIRVPALVSVLKAAHLTLFEMVGYEYALSLGGQLLGRAILGEFYLANSSRPKPEVVTNAIPYFRQCQHMVRPVVEAPKTLMGTADDRTVYVCRDGTLTWGMIVFVRSAHALHAALLPILDTPAGADRFVQFSMGRTSRSRPT